MRIVLLTSASAWRGSGTSYAKIARGLGERGHAATLVTTPRLASRLRDEGLTVTQLAGPGFGPRKILALRRVLRRVGAQAILADTPGDVRLSAYATLLHRARVVYRYNVSRQRPRVRTIGRLYLSRVAACVYQSEWIREDAIRRAPSIVRIPSHHIPNGFDLAQYAPQPDAGQAFRKAHGIPPSALVVLSVAKLARNKGQDVAIAALNRLQRQGLSAVYVLVGDGGLEGELVSMAGGYGLRAVFTGVLRSEQLVAAYNAADLLVHPSLVEIFPNVVGEAMACGRPVIASDSGGTAELVGRDGAAGVLVPPSDPVALAGAVEALLANPARREAIGRAARRRIQDEFPLARMIHEYETALAEVIGDGG